jgi:phage terminase Nu1 subunit (DNA packaging protein)
MDFSRITNMSSPKPTKAAICRHYRITAATLTAWQAEGIDVHDEQAMAERNARKHKTSGEELFDARLKKLQAEARSATLKADELAGQLISLADCEQAITKIGSITKSLLQRLRADLPPALEGQSPSRMADIISQAVEVILTQLSDPEAAPWREK